MGHPMGLAMPRAMPALYLVPERETYFSSGNIMLQSVPKMEDSMDPATNGSRPVSRRP
jgi:hypothetical protein